MRPIHTFSLPKKTPTFKFPFSSSIEQKWWGNMVKITFTGTNGEEVVTKWLWNSEYRSYINDKAISNTLTMLEERINMRMQQDIFMESLRKSNSEAKVSALFAR